MDDFEWNIRHGLKFFRACGKKGGTSRSPKKLAAAGRNLEVANAVRKAKAEERRQQQVAQGGVAPGGHQK